MLLTRSFNFDRHFLQSQQQQQQQQQQQDSYSFDNINGDYSRTIDDNLYRYHGRSVSNLGAGADADVDIDIDLDLDLDLDLELKSSSQLSTRSFLSQYDYNSPIEAGDTQHTSTLSQPNLLSPLPALIPSPSADLMHPESTWMSNNGPVVSKSVGRFSHNRESSLSSLGSAGPASPFSHTTSNPHIAVTDSLGDGYQGFPMHHGLSNQEDSYYQLAKSFAPNCHDNTFYPNYPTYQADPIATAAYSNMVASHRPKMDRGSLLPPPELSTGSCSRSRPISVASSIASDSPVTPSIGECEDERLRRNVGLTTVPKLDRTMTDVYSDELYSSPIAISDGNINTSTPSHSQVQGNGHANARQAAVHTPLSPSHEMFAQRIQAANSQHLNAVRSPVTDTSRERSPFRNGSPLAPSPSHEFGASLSGAPRHRHIRFNTAQQMRECRKAEQDARALRRQMAHGSDTATPQTISPKDAILEFRERDGDANFPLFPDASPSSPAQSLTTDQLNKEVAAGVPEGSSYDGGITLDTTGFGYGAPQLPAGIQIPQQYPFVAHTRTPSQQETTGSVGSLGTRPTEAGSPVTSHCHSGARGGVSSGRSSNSPAAAAAATALSPRRPEARASADGGTYTCTYHGCTLRFDTPALLQKHKREGHRQTHGLSSSSRRTDGGGVGATGDAPGDCTSMVGMAMTSSLLNTQAGPHRCDRINPSTGKPCNTIFSRPYDLTRHEDTIHNARKQKVRCNLCTEEKTFSRADALTRHYRVCHPDVDFPGKHRRRGAHHHAG